VQTIYSSPIRQIEVIPAARAEEFLDRISLRGEHFTDKAGARTWIFRGQRDASWGLEAAVVRAHRQRQLHPGFDSLWLKIAGVRSPSVSDFIAYEAEQLFQFYEYAERVGEISMLSDEAVVSLKVFARRLPKDALPVTPSWDGSWPHPALLQLLAMAQHYGLQTRLLDFTWSPHVAAYFAAVEYVNTELLFAAWPAGHLAPCTTELAVWGLSPMQLLSSPEVFNSRQLDDLVRYVGPPGMRLPAYTSVTAPNSGNPNLRAQQGLFLLAQHADCVRLDEFPFERLDQMVVATHESGGLVLKKVTLPVSEADQLLALLALDGIDGSHLFPGLGGAVRAIHENAFFSTRDHRRRWFYHLDD
jgi:hypothetical protein